MHLSLLLPSRLNLARPADRRLELPSAAVHGWRLPPELGKRSRLGIAQMAQQWNSAPVETHQRGAGHIHHARIFAPYQQPARLGTRSAAHDVIARDIHQVVYGAPE